MNKEKCISNVLGPQRQNFLHEMPIISTLSLGVSGLTVVCLDTINGFLGVTKGQGTGFAKKGIDAYFKACKARA